MRAGRAESPDPVRIIYTSSVYLSRANRALGEEKSRCRVGGGRGAIAEGAGGMWCGVGGWIESLGRRPTYSACSVSFVGGEWPRRPESLARAYPPRCQRERDYLVAAAVVEHGPRPRSEPQIVPEGWNRKRQMPIPTPVQCRGYLPDLQHPAVGQESRLRSGQCDCGAWAANRSRPRAISTRRCRKRTTPGDLSTGVPCAFASATHPPDLDGPRPGQAVTCDGRRRETPRRPVRRRPGPP